MRPLPSMLFAAFLVPGFATAAGQPPTMTGYYKNFTTLIAQPATGSTDGPRTLWFSSNRLRLDLTANLGEHWTFEAAYDLAPRFQDSTLFDTDATAQPTGGSAYRTADLDHALFPPEPGDTGSFALFQNLDRFSFSWKGEAADLTIGRQAIAWGSARVINPTDIIAPYAFNTLDQEERFGVDAVRLRLARGSLGELDLGGVFGENFRTQASAFYVRRKWHRHQTDLSVLAIGFRHHLLVGLDLTRPLGRHGFWFESALTKPGLFGSGHPDSSYLRASLGLDSQLNADTYGFVEYHYNSAGTRDTDDYLELESGPAYRDGAVYLLGRHYLSLGLTRQLTGLIHTSLTCIANLHDRSISLSPTLEYNLAENVYLSLGATIGIGPSPRQAQASPAPFQLRSEFGAYPDLYYASLRWYF